MILYPAGFQKVLVSWIRKVRQCWLAETLDVIEPFYAPLRKYLNGNVFHMKSPDKLLSPVIKFSLYIHSEFKILQPERSMWSLSLTVEGCKNERASCRWSSIKQSLIKHTPLIMHAHNIRLSLKWRFLWNKYKCTMISRPQLWSIQPGEA